MPNKDTIESCLARLESGDPGATRDMSSFVYAQLKRRAAGIVHKAPAGAIGPTTLVHEAYLRMIDGVAIRQGSDDEIMALGSKIMRDILVDFARRHFAQKRGGGEKRMTITAAGAAAKDEEVDLLDIHQALTDLAVVDPRLAEIVEMRWFGGRTRDEIAAHFGTSLRTIARELAMAQAWLRNRLGELGGESR